MSGALRLEGISKNFGGLEVLASVDLEIPAGERHALIGPNGAGKTTLINIITGKYRPSKGGVRFDGTNISEWSPYRRVRLGIARSFQIINVFPEMTVFENMRNAMLSKEGIRVNALRSLRRLRRVHEEADRAIEVVGLGAFHDVPAGELAYGKQRTLEIGLTLALAPRLLILDEPTAGISSAETHEMTALLRRMTEGRTMILVEHDMDVVFALADRISVLHYGRILAQGSPDDIRQNAEVKEAYLGTRDSRP